MKNIRFLLTPNKQISRIYKIQPLDVLDNIEKEINMDILMEKCGNNKKCYHIPVKKNGVAYKYLEIFEGSSAHTQIINQCGGIPSYIEE